MALLVDDVLAIPIQFFEVIFNSIIQTAYKATWSEYRRQLNVLLLRVKRDYKEGKVSKEEMQAMETKIFAELRLANRALSSR
ncbi:MAG: hypothetical protein ACYCQJ_07590 [Nitrososphaerales archaeon]